MNTTHKTPAEKTTSTSDSGDITNRDLATLYAKLQAKAEKFDEGDLSREIREKLDEEEEDREQLKKQSKEKDHKSFTQWVKGKLEDLEKFAKEEVENLERELDQEIQKHTQKFKDEQLTNDMLGKELGDSEGEIERTTHGKGEVSIGKGIKKLKDEGKDQQRGEDEDANDPDPIHPSTELVKTSSDSTTVTQGASVKANAAVNFLPHQNRSLKLYDKVFKPDEAHPSKATANRTNRQVAEIYASLQLKMQEFTHQELGRMRDTIIDFEKMQERVEREFHIFNHHAFKMLKKMGRFGRYVEGEIKKVEHKFIKKLKHEMQKSEKTLTTDEMLQKQTGRGIRELDHHNKREKMHLHGISTNGDISQSKEKGAVKKMGLDATSQTKKPSTDVLEPNETIIEPQSSENASPILKTNTSQVGTQSTSRLATPKQVSEPISGATSKARYGEKPKESMEVETESQANQSNELATDKAKVINPAETTPTATGDTTEVERAAHPSKDSVVAMTTAAIPVTSTPSDHSHKVEAKISETQVPQAQPDNAKTTPNETQKPSAAAVNQEPVESTAAAIPVTSAPSEHSHKVEAKTSEAQVPQAQPDKAETTPDETQKPSAAASNQEPVESTAAAIPVTSAPSEHSHKVETKTSETQVPQAQPDKAETTPDETQKPSAAASNQEPVESAATTAPTVSLPNNGKESDSSNKVQTTPKAIAAEGFGHSQSAATVTPSSTENKIHEKRTVGDRDDLRRTNERVGEEMLKSIDKEHKSAHDVAFEGLPKASDSQESIDKIAEQILVAEPGLKTNKEVRIQVKNNVLKDTHIILSMNDEKHINIKFITSDSGARRSINEHLTHLEKRLNEKCENSVTIEMGESDGSSTQTLSSNPSSETEEEATPLAKSQGETQEQNQVFGEKGWVAGASKMPDDGAETTFQPDPNSEVEGDKTEQHVSGNAMSGQLKSEHQANMQGLQTQLRHEDVVGNTQHDIAQVSKNIGDAVLKTLKKGSKSVNEGAFNDANGSPDIEDMANEIVERMFVADNSSNNPNHIKLFLKNNCLRNTEINIIMDPQTKTTRVNMVSGNHESRQWCDDNKENLVKHLNEKIPGARIEVEVIAITTSRGG